MTSQQTRCRLKPQVLCPEARGLLLTKLMCPGAQRSWGLSTSHPLGQHMGPHVTARVIRLWGQGWMALPQPSCWLRTPNIQIPHYSAPLETPELPASSCTLRGGHSLGPWREGRGSFCFYVAWNIDAMSGGSAAILQPQGQTHTLKIAEQSWLIVSTAVKITQT